MVKFSFYPVSLYFAIFYFLLGILKLFLNSDAFAVEEHIIYEKCLDWIEYQFKIFIDSMTVMSSNNDNGDQGSNSGGAGGTKGNSGSKLGQAGEIITSNNIL